MATIATLCFIRDRGRVLAGHRFQGVFRLSEDLTQVISHELRLEA